VFTPTIAAGRRAVLGAEHGAANELRHLEQYRH
jgi:hypothetical protein